MVSKKRRVRGQPSDTKVKVYLCCTPRCNRLTANRSGKCKRCLDFSVRQEALLARLRIDPAPKR